MAEDLRKNQSMPADFHSHILPSLDDGSEHVAQSLAMLAEAKRQGTLSMVATPHFYAENESPDDFLARRATSIRQLLDGGYDPSVHPRVYAGAEVSYFRGIGRCEDLARLCIVGTQVVLIEMPFRPWTDTMLEDVYSIQTRLELIPVLVHIERYPNMQKAVLRRTMVHRGILLQINANMMDKPMTRRRALHMLMGGEVQLLGSDCHNMTMRPPGMQKMLEYVKAHADPFLIPQMVELNRFLLRGATPLEKISIPT